MLRNGCQVPYESRAQDTDVGASSLSRAKHTSALCSVAGLRTIAKRTRIFFLRIDISWTLLYFMFLLCIAVVIISITDTLITRNLMETWHAIHFLRIRSVTHRIDHSSGCVVKMARTFLAVQLQDALSTASELTLSVLCSTLDNYDARIFYRAFVFVSLVELNAMGCVHGLANMDSLKTLTAFVSADNIDNGSFLVDSTTYELVQPLQQVTAWPVEYQNASKYVVDMYGNNSFFPLAEDYYYGRVTHIDKRRFWFAPPAMPHIIMYNLPIGVVARGIPLPPTQYPTDFVQVRLDGSQLLVNYNEVKTDDFVAAAFINATLQDDDPLVLSNTWGQDSVSNNSIYCPTSYLNVTYLKTSEIVNPLMRAALQHVHLKRLQEGGYNHTVDFQYKGAPATVTAVHVTLRHGLQVPMVFVNRQVGKVVPYRRIMDVWNGITAVAILVFTVLFWWFVHHSFSRPLTRMTALLHKSVAVGKRAIFYRDKNTCLQLTEVQELVEVHNNTMKQLRKIDAFVPALARKEMSCRRSAHAETPQPERENGVFFESGAQRSASTREQKNQFEERIMSIVYITVKAALHSAEQQVVEEVQHACAKSTRRGHPLAAVVEHVARLGSSSNINSGPFPTPLSLAGFVTLVRSLCASCHGEVHHLSPDSGILHFGTAVRTHMSRFAGAAERTGNVGRAEPTPVLKSVVCQQSEYDALLHQHAARDAHNAVTFALLLQQRLRDAEQEHSMPDVRVLIDTSRFVCGPYRSRGSEPSLSVALGRDVNRDLSHVPAAIGVHVAATEETARLVRELCWSTRQPALRMLPVEVLHTSSCWQAAQRKKKVETGDVVVLYEALPGVVEGDEAWQEYCYCYIEAFQQMRSGDYESAVRTFRGVAEIPDLAPGLLPNDLQREAVTSTSTDPVVSVQAQRLMEECRRRISNGDTTPFCRHRNAPFSAAAVLQSSNRNEKRTPAAVKASAVNRIAEHRTTAPLVSYAEKRRTQSICDVSHLCKARHRYVVTVDDNGQRLRCVLSDIPESIKDHRGQVWNMPAYRSSDAAVRLWKQSSIALGPAGTIATVTFFVFRDVCKTVADKITGAPDGPLSDALRSAVPVWEASAKQRRQVAHLYRGHQQLAHPNIMNPLSYSLSVEGGVVVLWEFCPGGSLRDLVERYPALKTSSLLRFAFDVASALSYLHERCIAHGSLSLDSVMLDADGACRLIGQFTDSVIGHLVFAVPRTQYVSPAMAAGHAPTPACDMFCYGLLSLEALTRRPAWRWADVADGVADADHTELTLQELMKEGGQAFSDAVVQGLVVPNCEALENEIGSEPFDGATREVLRRCLSFDANDRPTSVEVECVLHKLLIRHGCAVRSPEL